MLFRTSAIVATLALFQFLTVPLSADLAAPNGRKAAPDFALIDSTGASVKLSALKGKVVLLDFWETYCGGCMTEIPWYVEFQNKYKRNGLDAIGVSMDEDGWKSVKPFLKKIRVNYPIVIGNPELAQQYGGLTSMPVTLLIDRNGRIADFHVGMVDKVMFEGEIRTLLQEKDQSK
jgi:cytochrome c biogenesis protein CcmG/thiol:disulfide interchange protein DsbE